MTIHFRRWAAYSGLAVAFCMGGVFGCTSSPTGLAPPEDVIPPPDDGGPGEVDPGQDENPAGDSPDENDPTVESDEDAERLEPVAATYTKAEFGDLSVDVFNSPTSSRLAHITDPITGMSLTLMGPQGGPPDQAILRGPDALLHFVFGDDGTVAALRVNGTLVVFEYDSTAINAHVLEEGSNVFRQSMIDSDQLTFALNSVFTIGTRPTTETTITMQARQTITIPTA